MNTSGTHHQQSADKEGHYKSTYTTVANSSANREVMRPFQSALKFMVKSNITLGKAIFKNVAAFRQTTLTLTQH